MRDPTPGAPTVGAPNLLQPHTGAMIGLDDAPSYLRQKGLIDIESVLDGDLLVKALTRRNRNLAISRTDGPGYLIKQPEDPLAGRTLRREAGFYNLCRAEPGAEDLVAQMPRCLLFDPDRNLLALELIEQVRPLRDYYQLFPASAFPTAPAAGVGRCVGNLHRIFRGRPAEADLAWLAGEAPWIMQVHEPSIDHLVTITAGNHKLLQIIQSQPGLSARLDRLRPQWQADTLIHGDVKSDNILVVTAAAGEEVRDASADDVRLVDWELVQMGDPAWDVAGMLQDFIAFWVLSIPSVDSLPSMEWNAAYPFDVLRPAIRAFWRSYRKAAGLTPAEGNARLLRSVQFSAARLVQSAFELSTGFGHGLPKPAVLLLQISQNLLDDPAAGQIQLYGLYNEL